MNPVDQYVASIDGTKDIYSDIYNAKIFHGLWKDKIRWSKDYGGWFIYNGRFWQRDTNDEIKRYAMLTHAHLIKDLERIKDKKYFTHLKNSAADNKLNSMLSCAKPFLSALPEHFDCNDSLFNCLNGTLDLENERFTVCNPSDLITKSSNVKFEPLAQAPLWDKFLADIFLGNQEIIEFIQDVIGYSLTALTREQCLFIFYGSGRNGKSRFIDTVVNMMGDYAMNCPSSTFIRKQQASIPNDIARLKGARMVTAIENNQNVSFDESMIKQITGEDKITARFLNKEYFDFSPTFKIFFATNHKPNIRGTDIGIWRRIKMIPFKFQITDATEDKALGSKLNAELPGILNWALTGHLRWKKRGLVTPPAIKMATEAYKDDEDSVGQFIKDHCTMGEGFHVTVNEFKDRLIGFLGWRISQKQISGYMEAHGFKDADNRKKIDGVDVRVYTGLRFNQPYERQANMGWTE